MEVCPHCKKKMKKITGGHKKSCAGWDWTPPKKSKPKPCLCGFEEESYHKLKVHRSGCEVWLSRDKKAVQRERTRQTSIEKYGTEHHLSSKAVQDKRKQTNIEKYGAENPFCRESSVFEKVQESLEGKRPVLRGEDNPFAWDSTKEKIRETMSERYGADNPQQVPEIREKTIQTCVERYGVDYYFQTEEFKEKFRETCLKKYGAEHHFSSKEVQYKIKSTNLQRYGVENVLSCPEIYLKSYETNLRNHGGVHSQSLEEVREKAKETWLSKYGVDNPSKSLEVLERIKQTWVRNYGVPFPPQSRNSTFESPNKLEQRFDVMTPNNVYYTGDARYWVRHKGASKARNPDFIVLSQKQFGLLEAGAEPNDLRVDKVIEVFGDYWHGPEITGKRRTEHQKEVEDYYALCGIECLVLWEWEINTQIEETRNRVFSFLAIRTL